MQSEEWVLMLELLEANFNFWRVGGGAQVEKTSLLEMNLYGASVDVGRIHFLFGMLQVLGSHQNPRSLEEDESFFNNAKST